MNSVTDTMVAAWEGKPAEPVKQGAYDKAALLTLLQTGIWMVEFTKVDGTPTLMEATLDVSLLPLQHAPTSTTPRAEKDHLIHVYSPDRAGWRSFTVANVTRFYPK